MERRIADGALTVIWDSRHLRRRLRVGASWDFASLSAMLQRYAGLRMRQGATDPDALGRVQFDLVLLPIWRPVPRSEMPPTVDPGRRQGKHGRHVAGG